MVQHTGVVKDKWEGGLCWILASLLTTTVGFDNHSSLVGIRTKLTRETVLSKRHNILLIMKDTKCTGTTTHRSSFHRAPLTLSGVKKQSKWLHKYKAPVLTCTWHEGLRVIGINTETCMYVFSLYFSMLSRTKKNSVTTHYLKVIM